MPTPRPLPLLLEEKICYKTASCIPKLIQTFGKEKNDPPKCQVKVNWLLNREHLKSFLTSDNCCLRKVFHHVQTIAVEIILAYIFLKIKFPSALNEMFLIIELGDFCFCLFWKCFSQDRKRPMICPRCGET